MADQLNTFVAVCSGGLVTNTDPLTQASAMSGSAIRMINYEPALSGGYRRITGYLNDYGTVPGTGAVLGVHVNGYLKDGIFACRKPSAGITIYITGITLHQLGWLLLLQVALLW